MKLILSPEANEELENLHTYIAEVQQAPMQAADAMIQVYESLYLFQNLIAIIDLYLHSLHWFSQV